MKSYAESTPNYEIHNLTLPVYDDSSISVYRPQNAAGNAAVYVVRTIRKNSRWTKRAIPLRIEDEVDAGSGLAVGANADQKDMLIWKDIHDEMDDELKYLNDSEVHSACVTDF